MGVLWTPRPRHNFFRIKFRDRCWKLFLCFGAPFWTPFCMIANGCCIISSSIDSALPFHRFWNGVVVSFSICFTSVLLGSVWAVVGILVVLASAVWGCSRLALSICIAFVVLRFAAVAIFGRSLFVFLDEVQRHRARLPVLANSCAPADDMASPIRAIPSLCAISNHPVDTALIQMSARATL